jgi:hypothetical protein
MFMSVKPGDMSSRLASACSTLVPYFRFPVILYNTPLRGTNNKKPGDPFEIKNLKQPARHLHSSREH